ncbi:MAG: ABC transporter ATP-binding protein/permease [Clostridiales bacterium]|jgi:ATP-binding cassette subfamily B protein|nr:ABC transporter ATP-binding protein/permease [Clostridiales bacterium]
MFKILKHLNTKEWIMIGLSVALLVFSVWLDLTIPEYMSKITRLVQTDSIVMQDIMLNGVYMLLLALGSLALTITVGFFTALISASFAKRLRSKLYNAVDSFSMGEINKFSTPSLITRSTNDITQVQMLIVMGMQMMIKAPITAVWALIKISNKGQEWTIATGIAVILLVLLMSFVLIVVMPKFKRMQVLTDNINRITRENLVGLPVVRAYNAEHYQQGKFEKANVELMGANLFVNRSMAFVNSMMPTIMSSLSLSVYWIGAVIISKAQDAEKLILFSNMIVFSSYSLQIVMSFMMLTMVLMFLPRASVSAKRINEVLDTKISIVDGIVDVNLEGVKGEVVFDNVSFKYPDAAGFVLKDISFTARSGETVAFIGSTGSGKSTLINLIPRFYDATEGSVLVNGVNVKDYKLDKLNDKIGYISQKAVVFSGTVSSNVAFGEHAQHATQASIKDAVSIAQGTDFVEKMQNSYNADIARGGGNLSGGQKQRLSIARAISKNPEIYIFDDSFSALDYKTDRALRSALKTYTKEATKLIVAQRIGTIMDADKIIVLDEGCIVGIGKHRDLLNDCKVYKEIALSQLSEEELAI